MNNHTERIVAAGDSHIKMVLKGDYLYIQVKDSDELIRLEDIELETRNKKLYVVNKD